MTTIFPVDWAIKDVEYNGELRAEIHAWGKSIDGISTLVRITFTPYFFVKTPGWSESRQKLYVSDACQKYQALAGSSMPVKRVPLLGFTNNCPTQFVQLAFPTLEAFRKAKYAIQRDRLATFEASLDPLLRFFHIREIQPAAWIRVSAGDVCIDDKISNPYVTEYITGFRNVSAAPEITEVPRLVIASWDLECTSSTHLFPDSSKSGDAIITIGTAFQMYGEDEPYLRSAITLDTCDPIPGVDVVACASEHIVINEWLELLQRERVDVMIGYNTLGFDYKYLDGRGMVLMDDDTGESLVRLTDLGHSVVGGGDPIEKNLSSAAYGQNNYFYLSSPGIMTLDLLQIFRKELKLESYSLGNVSKKYLDDGETKIDLKPGEIFAKFTQGSAERAEIATYCVRDVELPLKLMRRLSTLENALQMANAVCCPIDFLQNRGQQIRVYSQLIRKARSLGFVCPDTERHADGPPPEKYEGATVLNANRGAYFDIICALDFASLYPSIIRAHCMCPSTLVMDPRYDALDGIEYYEIDTGTGVVRFAQNVKCVVPELLKELAEFRKQAKKDMAAASDPFQKAMFNAKQLAYKVSMNSVYGFFGATRGMLPVVQMAAAVTATGRRMIEHSKSMAETLVPGTDVVYGDSVMPYTPVLIKESDGTITIRTIESLVKHPTHWTSYDGFKVMDTGLRSKEQASLESACAWTHRGWARINRVVRHKCKKKIYRVLTHSGLVDVTEDHSLLDPAGKHIKPRDVFVGMDLLHSFPETTSTGELFPETVMRRKWLETKNQFAAQHYYMSLRNMGRDVTLEMTDDDTIRLVFDASPTPPMPHAITYITVLHDEYDGYVYDIETSAGVFQAGVGSMIVKNTDSILCKFAVPEEKRYDMHHHFQVAEYVADAITKTFKHPIELEFEKTYYPYLLFSKKRYAGNMFVKPDAPDNVDVKGLQLVRRDNAPVVKLVSTRILNAIMHDRSPEKAISLARESVLRVLRNEEPLEHFVISKALRTGYKNPNSLPHVIVAQKLKERRGYPPASGERVPYVFIRDPDAMDGLIAKRAEDPEYVREHSVDIDTLYYVENQLLSPITTLLDVLVDDVHKEIMGDPEIARLVDDLRSRKKSEINVAKRIRTNTHNKQHEITRFFVKKT
jgi:DNA polymerase delta subunit 1